MIEEIRELVHETCKSETNLDGYGAWTHHIAVVVENAKALAKKLKADEEIVELAALLHDYASVLNREWQEDHHIHSAKLAQELLEKYDYPKELIDRVVHCILAHRGSGNTPKESLEAKIVASADAMTHIQFVYELLHYAYAVRNREIEEGREWVLAKIGRSWNKLMPEAKEMVGEQYKAAKIVLTK